MSKIYAINNVSPHLELYGKACTSINNESKINDSIKGGSSNGADIGSGTSCNSSIISRSISSNFSRFYQ